MLGFKVAVNGSLTRYNLVDQSIDEFYDTSGVDSGASSNNERIASGDNYYYAGQSGTNPTGGTITTYTGYRVHSFLTSSTLVVGASTGDIDIWVVAGGGAGGGKHGGGGGAGGWKLSAAETVTASTTYTVTVGTGGASSSSVYGGNGINSEFSGTGISTLTALKGAGGAGGGGSGAGTGGDGTYASGGGGYAAAGAGGAGTSGQGYDGGTGGGTDGVTEVSGGAGGGAGSVGGNSPDGNNGGAGGTGIQNLYRTGVNQYYAGGGGGRGLTAGGAGGSSVGGAGASGSGAQTGAAGATNTGSGGGGGHNAASGVGADGIVVIRYADDEFQTIGDMTLQSTDVTAETEADFGEFVTLIENAYGTATLNTDIKGYVSRDSGTTFTQGTLVDEGTWGTNKQVLGFHDLDISSQPSGTSMCYKITTHNQVAASKETRVYATSIGWR